MVMLFSFYQDSHTDMHLSESSTMVLERVDRHHAGIYQCIADNGVREPVHVDIELTVLCKFMLLNNFYISMRRRCERF